MRFFVAVFGVTILCLSGSPLGGTTLPSPYRPSPEVEARCGEFENEEFEPCVRALVFDLVADGSRNELLYDAVGALLKSRPSDLENVLLRLMEKGYYVDRVAESYWSLRLEQESDRSERIDLLERVLSGELQYSERARGWAAWKLCGMGVPHLREPIREAVRRLHINQRQLCEAKMALADGQQPGFIDFAEGMRTALEGEYPHLSDSVLGRFAAWCARGIAEEYEDEHRNDVREIVLLLRRLPGVRGAVTAQHLYSAFRKEGMEEDDLRDLGFVHGYPTVMYWWDKTYRLPPSDPFGQ